MRLVVSACCSFPAHTAHRSGIVGRWLWVYWEDDAQWWPAKVISVVRVNPFTVLLLYETGTCTVVQSTMRCIKHA